MQINNFNDSFKSRIAKGVSANVFCQIVTILIQVVSVPLFIHYWGVGLYGEWLVLSAIPAYLTLIEFGFANSASNEMTKAVSSNLLSLASSVYRSAWSMVTTLCSILVVSLLFGVNSIDISPLFNIEKLSEDTAIILSLFLIQVFFIIQCQTLWPALKCNGLYATAAFLSGIVRIIEFVVCILFLVVFNTPLMAAVGILIGRILGFVLALYITYSKNNWLLIGQFSVDFKIVRKLFPSAIGFSAIPMASLCLIQGLTIIVSATLGPTLVVVFTVSRTLSRIAFQIADKLKDTLWPDTTRNINKGNISSVISTLFKLMQFNVWIIAILLVLLFLLSDEIIYFWTSGTVDLDKQFFIILLLALYLNTIWNSLSLILLATSNHKFVSYLNLFLALLLLSTSSFLADRFGLVGIAAGLLFIDFMMLPFIVVRVVRILDIEIKGLLLNSLIFPSWILKFNRKNRNDKCEVL
ncbi:hypothetical protein DRW07_03630 [Alteromonas sediminis]|uniref:Polysaccharide biosynthesis protein n=1 Tax=Alteromonas sediminis TaxID=2259342 RepID=A0A3N5Y5Q7_9ALTE|nr:hypothetical protein [Alteromonas sediminis]RPJ68506.1 hypothetical protein DRW07_03630 [Alteromonas sediminis]